MRALVTGATGCVGANIVEALLDGGYDVRALHRPTSRLDALAGLAPELVVGDVLDESSLREAMAGCGVVFHAAAMAQYWRQSPSLLYAVNIVGTRNVLRVAVMSGVERVVLTSSVAALGVPERDGRPRDESSPFNWAPARFHYGHSKLLAEAEARRAIAEGLDVVCVNPATVLGRRDINFVGGEILRAVHRGYAVVAPPGGMGVVAAEVVGAGHVLAAESGRTGERYILNGENITHRDLLTLVAAELGRRPPWLTVPRGVTRLAARLGRAALQAVRLPPPPLLVQLDLCARDMYFDGRKAERELGLPRIGARVAVKDAWHWYREHGLL